MIQNRWTIVGIVIRWSKQYLSKNKKAEPNNPAFWKRWLEDVYFLIFLRPNSARPIKPKPSSKSWTGVETGEVTLLPICEFVTMLDVVGLGVRSSYEVLATIPKNKITTHKIINNFFTYFSFYENSCGRFQHLWCRWIWYWGEENIK